VRLLRIEKGKAFVDLLNGTANDSGDNEMGYGFQHTVLGGQGYKTSKIFKLYMFLAISLIISWMLFSDFTYDQFAVHN
jgi:hypothetical protein